MVRTLSASGAAGLEARSLDTCVRNTDTANMHTNSGTSTHRMMAGSSSNISAEPAAAAAAAADDMLCGGCGEQTVSE